MHRRPAGPRAGGAGRQGRARRADELTDGGVLLEEPAGGGPQEAEDGTLRLSLPLGGAKLPGIAARDIGRCALGIFRRGPSMAGQRFGIAGEILSDDEIAAAYARVLGRDVAFQDVPFDVYWSLGFPGAEDMGNMFQYQAIMSDAFLRARDPELARDLNPDLLTFSRWLEENARLSAGHGSRPELRRRTRRGQAGAAGRPNPTGGRREVLVNAALTPTARHSCSIDRNSSG